jgi:uncharacterized protein
MNIVERVGRSNRSLRAIGMTLALVAAVIGGTGRIGRVGAQEATPVPAAGGQAVVTVLGHGSVTVKPDIATINVGVTVTAPALADAQRQATRLMTKVVAAIKKDGVKDEDIQTSYYSVNVVSSYDNNGNPTGVTGYQVSNQVAVTVRDLDKVNSILEDAVAAGANSIYGITFGVADPSAAASQARAAAVADARTRAEELATAAGLTLGRVLSISEGVPQPVPYAAGQAAGKGGAVPIETGGLEVTVDVQVTYELQ